MREYEWGGWDGIDYRLLVLPPLKKKIKNRGKKGRENSENTGQHLLLKIKIKREEGGDKDKDKGGRRRDKDEGGEDTCF